jgi:hypothetical protein
VPKSSSVGKRLDKIASDCGPIVPHEPAVIKIAKNTKLSET